MKEKSCIRSRLFQGKVFAVVICLLWLLPAGLSWAVTSKITRHSSSSELLKGRTENVVVSSRGTIKLGRSAKVLVKEFEDVWSVNSIVEAKGIVYIGTSPNGAIYKYKQNKLTKIYPLTSSKKPAKSQKKGSNDNEESDVGDEEHLSNEHIFAMALDAEKRLLAGISGEKCRLCRFQAGNIKTLFEPNDAKYIFAILTDEAGNIYLGTGPEGKVYQLDPSGTDAKLVYDCLDKNILALTISQDGLLYAGSDGRGLVYKIDPRAQTATVLYDCDEPEVTSLLFEQGPDAEGPDLYALATSAKIVQSESKFAEQMPAAGRPEVPSNGSEETNEGGRSLKIANTERENNGDDSSGQARSRKPAKPRKASHIYRISKKGFVTDLFSETAIFFCLAQEGRKLLLGTGNDGRLFSVDPVSEREAIIYEDEQASQVTAVAVSGTSVYAGTANPAKLIKLDSTFAREGTYISDLIDAGQPAKWGKLQIEADVPQGCKVLVASRSGNVKDVNDPTVSDWTEPVEVTEPIQLRCPLGRFCQYKIVLQTENGRRSPLVREIAVASTVPNLAPQVESVSVNRAESSSKTGVFEIDYKAEDANEDKLVYKLYFRKIGRTNWIELEDETEADDYEWDGKTVEDGRYEVRVIASDERSNTPGTKLSGSRISDPVVVDNTGPVIKNIEKRARYKNGEKTITLKLQVFDELSAIGRLDYTIDSNSQWRGAIPDDLVYDTMDENFTLIVEDVKPGEHVLAVRVKDDVGNVTYRTLEFNF